MSLGGDALPLEHWAGAEVPAATFQTRHVKQLIVIMMEDGSHSLLTVTLDEDIARLPDTRLREVLLNVDVALQDFFCEGRRLTASWETPLMPASPLTFSAVSVKCQIKQDQAVEVFRVGTLP